MLIKNNDILTRAIFMVIGGRVEAHVLSVGHPGK